MLFRLSGEQLTEHVVIDIFEDQAGDYCDVFIALGKLVTL